MNKEIKLYVKNVGIFVEQFAQARLIQLGASKKISKHIAEDIKSNVMKKDPSAIRYWTTLATVEKTKLAECMLMLKEIKHVLLKKDNEGLVKSLNEFIVTSTKSLVEAVKVGNKKKLIESLAEPVKKIETFSQVQTIHKALNEAQSNGDEEALIRLKKELDKLAI